MTFLVGTMPVRNEAWVLRFSAPAALTWVDHLIFLEHACTDETATILRELGERYGGEKITILTEFDGTWAEMDHRQRLLEAARAMHATHIAIIDADEVLSANLRSQVREKMTVLPPGFTLEVPLLNCWRSLDQYRNDEESLFGCVWATLLFRDAPTLCWKPRGDGYQHHSRRPINGWPGIRVPPEDRDQGGLLHLQHASWARLTAKQRLYKMREVLQWPERARQRIDLMYSQALDEQGARIFPVPPAWWDYNGLDRALIAVDARPWQQDEAARLMAKHGRAAFAGLDLFEELA